MDDIFVVWSGTHRQVDSLTGHLNSIHKNIQFTTEIGNKTISFLDLIITIINQKLEYQIFRKPTFTDTIIPFSSNHLTNTKFSAFYSMINRLIQIPLNKDNVNKELNTIYNIASHIGFNRKTISKLFNKINKKHDFKSSLYHQNPKKSIKESPLFRIISPIA